MGSLKPNDLGLFDMHGNIWEWCQDAYGAYGDGESKNDQEENPAVKDEDSRVLRGGSFFVRSSNVRSASRGLNRPTLRGYSFGFRLARTLQLAPLVDSPHPPEGGEIKKTDK